MIDFFTKRRLNSVLGLSLNGNRLEAVVLRRGNGAWQTSKSVSVPLTLAPLTGDPALVGREIRNHLDQAGIRERKCAVCLPLDWVLTFQTALPEIPEADVPGFLELEAERGFPSGADSLFIVTSRAKPAGGEALALQMGVPRNHLTRLETVLKAAQLRPVHFTLGITALQPPGELTAAGVVALVLAPHGIDLQITSGGGIIALRSLDGGAETEGVHRGPDADLVARELRITLGNLPGALGDGLRKLKVFGRGDAARRFVDELTPRAQSLGLKLELIERASPAEFVPALPAEIVLSPAVSVAVNLLAGAGGPEFLPPKEQPWKQLLSSNKLTTGKLVWAGGAVAVIALLAGAAFGWQQWQINSYESQYADIKGQVEELRADQQQLAKYHPWFDETYRSLRILKKISEAFPPTGTVTARSLEIKDLTTVTCTGVAQNNQAYFRVSDELEKVNEVTGLTSDFHGQNPLQFTLNFQWEGVKPGGN